MDGGRGGGGRERREEEGESTSWLGDAARWKASWLGYLNILATNSGVTHSLSPARRIPFKGRLASKVTHHVVAQQYRVVQFSLGEAPSLPS